MVYFIRKRKVFYMMTAKVFKNGRSQAIRLPKEVIATNIVYTKENANEILKK